MQYSQSPIKAVDGTVIGQSGMHGPQRSGQYCSFAKKSLHCTRRLSRLPNTPFWQAMRCSFSNGHFDHSVQVAAQMGEVPERSQLLQMDTKTTRVCAEAIPVAGSSLVRWKSVPDRITRKSANRAILDRYAILDRHAPAALSKLR
jgi:hypothetical protein